MECLNSMAEVLGPDFVIAEITKHAAENKNPKVAIEALNWIASTVEDFGLEGPPAPVDLPKMMIYVRVQLESSNNMARSAAVKVVCKLFLFLRESIRDQLSEVRAAVMTTVDKEIAKYANAKTPEPTKTYKPNVLPLEEVDAAEDIDKNAEVECNEQVQTNPSQNKAADDWVDGAVDVYEDEPAPPERVDITPQLTPQLFNELGHAKDWKMRKDALDKIRKILSDANMSIDGNALGILMPKLCARLKDINKNLVLYTIKLLGLVGT